MTLLDTFPTGLPSRSDEQPPAIAAKSTHAAVTEWCLLI
jgi:hypothetical protein